MKMLGWHTALGAALATTLGGFASAVGISFTGPAAAVPAGLQLPLGSDADQWANWLDLIIKVLAIVIGFLAGKKSQEK